jgi:hypothetical protein
VPAQVGTTTANASLGGGSVHADGADPWPGNATGGNALAPGGFTHGLGGVQP